MTWKSVSDVAILAESLRRLEENFGRLEKRLDETIQQTTADRLISSSHIATCTEINRRADEDEAHAKSEWTAFKANVFAEIEGLADKVVETRVKLAWLIGGVAGVGWALTGVGWAADHYHWALGGGH